MSFARYPAYKQSAVAWLGSIPERWSILRLKHACEVFPSNVDKHARDDEPPVRLCNYTDVYYNERITADMSFMEATASTDQVARFTLRAGDTIITKDSETADDIAVSAYVPEDLPGVVCGYHLSMVRPKESICGAYVKRLFDCHYARARFAVAANGLTRVGLGQYALDNVELPFPPFNEQAAIAAFLDRETAKIDALVEEQKRLIELLKEKRQAVISQAVTKGLDPNVPMKDSGVEWMGKVPAHWGVMALKREAEFITSGARGWADNYSDDGELFLRIGNLTRDTIRLDLSDTQRVAAPVSAESERTRALPGDLLFSITAYLGSVAVIPEGLEPAYVSQHVALVRLKGNRLVHKWVAYVAASHVGKAFLETQGYGGAKIQLSLGDVANLVMLRPDAEEQRAIVDHIERGVSRLGELIDGAACAVQLLQERRSALIAAAVTGKIDVRGLVPQYEAALA